MIPQVADRSVLHCKHCCKSDTIVCPVRCVLGSQPQFNTHQPFTHCQIPTRTHECIRRLLILSSQHVLASSVDGCVHPLTHPLISSRAKNEKDDLEKSESEQSRTPRTPVGRFSLGINRISVVHIFAEHEFAVLSSLTHDQHAPPHLFVQ